MPASIGSYEFSAQDQWTRGGSGLRLGATNIYPLDGSGNLTTSQVDFGSLARQFKDAYFSGTVNAGNLRTGVAVIGDIGAGLRFGASAIYPCDQTGNVSVNSDWDFGDNSWRFKDAYFSGTVDAAGFTVNGSPIGGGSGGLPDGGYTYGWSITATDFIATSDERLKDNITTAPVGLIDSLKGREWDWASGEKGSGVVAQELEQVLPHLVHEDEEGMKSVAYNGLIAYLIEEIKDLKAQVEALK